MRTSGGAVGCSVILAYLGFKVKTFFMFNSTAKNTKTLKKIGVSCL